MFHIYFFLSMLITINLYGMENGIKVEPINNKEDLQTGLNITFKAFDNLYQQRGLNEEQQKVLEENRKNRLQQLLTISERNDIFVKENDAIIGFLASHLEKNGFVVFDNAFLGTHEKKAIVHDALLNYTKQTYPTATKIWLALIKHPATTQLAQSYGFEESDYMDNSHNTENWQGWEREIK